MLLKRISMEVERMTAKEFLNRARQLTHQIKLLYNRIEELKALETSIPGPNYDQEVVDKSRSLEAPFLKYLYKRIETEELVKAEEERLVGVLQEIGSVIAEVENPTHQQLLRLRYLDFFNWNDIASEMGYSKDNVYKLHRQALEKITV